MQYLNDDMVLDQDFTTDPYFTLRQKRREGAFTGDFVARGPQTGKYSWLAGLFGFWRHSRMNAPVTFYSTGIDRLIVSNRNNANPHYPIGWDSDNFVLGSEFRLPSGGMSVYHESTLKLGDFSLGVGLRFDWERTQLHYRSFCNTGFTTYDNSSLAGGILPVYSHTPLDIDDRGFISKDYTQLLPKFSLTYALPETTGNLYATVTKGYKSGGYNTQMFSDFLQQRIMSEMGMAMLYDAEATVSYRPETDWNYELGAHFNLLDGRISADLAAFWLEIDNQQVTMFPGRKHHRPHHGQCRTVALARRGGHCLIPRSGRMVCPRLMGLHRRPFHPLQQRPCRLLGQTRALRPPQHSLSRHRMAPQFQRFHRPART